ncbi:hypothetical protein [Sedimentisphaera salicampi]|uniref:EF-hand domain-containing protein n=1 Tax=Sedimentisphaera salicampi TaxID=1941349 RepID=A0A1W6LND5_9BACT|nr:hypothetical protein [Sedimentisphaera salicampi]ARN57295.1 hypothetical protein STSP1_01698 [Sedimentisphaera salicampi]
MKNLKSILVLLFCAAAFVQAYYESNCIIEVPNGQIHWGNGDYDVVAFSVDGFITAEYVVMQCLDDNTNDSSDETYEVAITSDSAGANVLTSAQVTENFGNTGDCDSYTFDFPDVELDFGTYYIRTKTISGAPVRSWGVDRLYYTGKTLRSDSALINVPNGQLYWNNGDSHIASFTLNQQSIATNFYMACLDDNNNDSGIEVFEAAITTDSKGSNVITSVQVSEDFGNTAGCDSYDFDFPDVLLEADTTYYLRTKVISGAPVRSWGKDYLWFMYQPPHTISSDFNKDGIVNCEDLMMFSQDWLAEEAWY